MLYYQRQIISHYTAWGISQVNIVDPLNIHPFHNKRKIVLQWVFKLNSVPLSTETGM
jgi:hypothetical protein